ncbi:mitogen-activated protein kinase [Hamiltosporidium magnivora]|uniref:Mitogen-activated protein kinase n=1 Tax=Hamiltosporidium magnivora TaxID=148818 RepID=A0A4Q9LG29_9MICR|nr:mitogen-activated protein kinase [Hamiltosporidium magnivora]
MIWYFCLIQVILSSVSQEIYKNTLYLEANQAVDIDMEGLNMKKTFVAIQKIGKGSYSDVFKCRDLSDGNFYALKFSSIQDSMYLKNEAYFYQQNPSEYIIKYYGFGRTTINNKMYVAIVLELGLFTVHDFIMNKDLSRVQIQIIIKQVLDGLNFLHSNNYVYNDLKLNNLVFTDRVTIKFLDFGLCSYNFGPLKIFSSNISEKEKMKFAYIAPEVRDRSYYNKKADIWSLGALIWSIHTKENFEGSVASLQLDLETKHFLSFLLQENYSIRPTIDLLFFNNYLDEMFTCLDDFSDIGDFDFELENFLKICKKNNVIMFKTEEFSFFVIRLDLNDTYQHTALRKMVLHYTLKNMDFCNIFAPNFNYSKYIDFVIGFNLSQLHCVTQLDFKSLCVLESLMHLVKNIEFIQKEDFDREMIDFEYLKNLLEFLDCRRDY